VKPDEPTGHKWECVDLNCQARRFVGVDDAAKERPTCNKCGGAMKMLHKPVVKRR
jgi:hypothetical protein